MSAAPASPNEEWRPVVGAGGLYDVSSLGRVRSKTRIVTLANGVKRICRGRILKGGFNRGYAHVSLRSVGGFATRRVHQLVCEAFNGPRPFPEAMCRHLDDVRANNVPANLAWGTNAENTQDAIRNGKRPVGDQRTQAKLTAADVVAIRAARSRGVSGMELAVQYGVSFGLIYRIEHRVRWAHLPPSAEAA